MRHSLCVGVVLLLAWLAGCSCSEDSGPTPLSTGELASLPAVTPTELQALLAEQTGKVVVLAVWSVTREASRAMYPKLGDLCKSGPEPVVIAVNIDHVDDVRAKVLPLLEQHPSNVLNRVCRVGPEGLSSFLDLQWMGQMPALALYDRTGKKADTFHGPDAFAKAQARLAERLKKRKR